MFLRKCRSQVQVIEFDVD